MSAQNRHTAAAVRRLKDADSDLLKMLVGSLPDLAADSFMESLTEYLEAYLSLREKERTR